MTITLGKGSSVVSGKKLQGVGQFYITPIYDRSQVDIANNTEKAYFNPADWNRIYHNSVYVNALVSTIFGKSVTFQTIAVMSFNSIPSYTDLNNLIGNINAILDAIELPPILKGPLELHDDWGGGYSHPAPTYLDANGWEYTLDQAKIMAVSSQAYWIHCGVANAGQERWRQHMFRGV